MTKQPQTTQSSAEINTAYDRRCDLVMQAFDNYHMHLLYYINDLTRHHQDAEDILQSLWNHVLLHFKEKDINSFPLLRRKAYQQFIDAYRSNKRRPLELTEDYAGLEPIARLYEAHSDAEEQALKNQFWSEFPTIELTDLA